MQIRQFICSEIIFFLFPSCNIWAFIGSLPVSEHLAPKKRYGDERKKRERNVKYGNHVKFRSQYFLFTARNLPFAACFSPGDREREMAQGGFHRSSLAPNVMAKAESLKLLVPIVATLCSVCMRRNMNNLTGLKAFPLTFDWIHKEFNVLFFCNPASPRSLLAILLLWVRTRDSAVYFLNAF